MYQGMADGLSLLFTFQNQLYLITGIIAGIVLGALPGFNASTAMVVLLPFTYLLEPVESLILLSGVAGAGIYGGSITAILFRTPGTIGSIVSAIDGYELTRKGQGVRALGISTTASAIGSIFSAVALLAVAPPLAVFATKFSFAEMFVLIIWSFTIIAALGGSLLKGLAAGAFGRTELHHRDEVFLQQPDNFLRQRHLPDSLGADPPDAGGPCAVSPKVRTEIHSLPGRIERTTAPNCEIRLEARTVRDENAFRQPVATAWCHAESRAHRARSRRRLRDSVCGRTRRAADFGSGW